MEGDPTPGSLGQMDSTQAYSEGEGYGNAGFEDEPPLLVELGIDFNLIKQKVRWEYVVVQAKERGLGN